MAALLLPWQSHPAASVSDSSVYSGDTLSPPRQGMVHQALSLGQKAL